MSATQYIGARYVPLFADPLTWDIAATYEPLTIVYHQGNSYTSRQAVPAGIDITNTNFWALTGNYNAQVEQYRQEVRTYDGRITANTNSNSAQDAQLAGTSASGLKTLIDANTAGVTENATDISALENQMAGTDPSGLKTAIEAEAAARASADTTINNQLAGTANSGLLELIGQASDDAQIVAGVNAFSKSITPIYVGDALHNRGLQAVAVAGDYFYGGFYAEGKGSQIDMFDRATNTKVRSVEITPESHLNSMAYDDERDVVWVIENGIQKYTPNLLNKTQFVTSASGISCIAFDFVTKTLWAFSGLTSDATQDIYKMELDGTDLEYFCTMQNVKGRQDFAVYDDVMVVNSSRSWVEVFSIDRANNTVVRQNSFTLDHTDTSGKWQLQEPEGLAFNEGGYLFMGYNTPLGTGANGTSYAGFFCTIPYGGRMYPNTPSVLTVKGHPIMAIDASYQEVFTLGINQLRSIAQTNCIHYEHVSRIDFTSDIVDNVYGGGCPQCSIAIQNIGHNVSVIGFSILGGQLTLNNTGTLTVAASVVNVLNTASIVIFRNAGTVHNSGSLVSYASLPAIVYVTDLGTVDSAVIGNNYYTATDHTYVIGQKGGTY